MARGIWSCACLAQDIISTKDNLRKEEHNLSKVLRWNGYPSLFICSAPNMKGILGFLSHKPLIMSVRSAPYTGILFSTLYLLVLVFLVDKISFMQLNLSVLIAYWHKSSTTSTNSSAKPFRGENLAQKAQVCWRNNFSHTAFLSCMQLALSMCKEITCYQVSMCVRHRYTVQCKPTM